MSYHKWTPAEARVAEMLREKGASNEDIAAALNRGYNRDRTGEKVRDAFRKGTISRLLGGEPETVVDRVTTEQNEDGSFSVRGNRPFSDEEMFAMWGLKQEDWFVQKRVINTWATHFQTKLWLLPAAPLEDVMGKWEEYLAEVRAHNWGTPSRAPLISDGHLLYEIAPFDVHVGLKSWGPETGGDYDLYIAIKRLKTAYLDLLYRAPEGTSRVLTVVGQDLAHFDNLIEGKGATTAKGTVQDTDTRWQKLFVALCQVWLELLTETANLYPVDVIVQPGNHDTRTSFYIGQWLEARLHDDPNIRFDSTPKPRKYYRFGQNLLGFSHGDKEKRKDWAALMATEAPEAWGSTVHREWHLGHLHHESVTEVGGLYVRRMRALAAQDAWHREGGYRTRPGMQAFTWHPEFGIVSQNYYNVPTEEVETDHLGVILSAD